MCKRCKRQQKVILQCVNKHSIKNLHHKLMKNILLFTAIVISSFIYPSCNSKTEKASCCKTDAGESEKAGEISDESVFLLDSKWETNHEQTIQLSDFNGKVVVAAMFFTTCPSACPRIAADMKNIESALTAEEREKTQFVLITMDTEYDTPEQMQYFADNHRLGDSWELLRSDKNETMEIANVLGVRIKPLESGGFDHSNIIHILNQKGEIVYQQMGLNIDPTESLREIRKLF